MNGSSSSGGRGRATKGFNPKAVTDAFDSLLSGEPDEDREVWCAYQCVMKDPSNELNIRALLQCLTSEGIIKLAAGVGITDITVRGSGVQ